MSYRFPNPLSKTENFITKSVDIFPEPDLNNNETVVNPTGYLYNMPDLISPFQGSVPLKKIDLLLVNCLNSFGKIETEDRNGVVLVKSENPIQTDLLDRISLFPANYQGRQTPTAEFSCNLLAGRLKLPREKFVENDYFKIIAAEEALGNTLIAFDGNWILPGIADYISQNRSYQMSRPGALREDMAVITTQGKGWYNPPKLNGIESDLSSLKIYPFTDSNFTCEQGSMCEVYMVFAPFSTEEAEKINLYLYRNIKMYSTSVFLSVRDMFLPKAKDLEHLFPLQLSFIGNYVILTTDKMTADQLQHLYHFDELYFSFPRLDDLQGAYGAYLLAEATFWEYRICWENNRLFIGMCGYIQAIDLTEHFGSILNEITRENPYFQELPNFNVAARISAETDIKCFYYLGQYYAAAYEQFDLTPFTEENLPNPSFIEMTNPLNAISKDNLRKETLSYLSSLGYNVEPNPIPYQNKLEVGYTTYEINCEAKRKLETVYYYRSSANISTNLQTVDGPVNQEILTKLQQLLQTGFFFTQRVKNLTRGYPDWTPSDSPLNRNLPRNPVDLLAYLSRV